MTEVLSAALIKLSAHISLRWQLPFQQHLDLCWGLTFRKESCLWPSCQIKDSNNPTNASPWLDIHCRPSVGVCSNLAWNAWVESQMLFLLGIYLSCLIHHNDVLWLTSLQRRVPENEKKNICHCYINKSLAEIRDFSSPNWTQFIL